MTELTARQRIDRVREERAKAQTATPAQRRAAKALARNHHQLNTAGVLTRNGEREAERVLSEREEAVRKAEKKRRRAERRAG